MLLLALLSLGVAGYAHYRLASHAPNLLPAWVGHLLLVVVGLALAWTMHSSYAAIEGHAEAWVFILTFSAVHLPAACILWLKKQRRKQLK